ncbi:MAG: PHB depolymerase family esterase [Rhodoglobus sp.]
MKPFLLLCLVAALLAGCAPRAPQPVPAAQTGVEHQVDGRSYLLTVPSALPAGPVPLVIMLHGGFGSGKQAEESYGWDALAASDGFIVAYPDGIDHAWNAGGGCCGKSGRSDTNDVAFIESVVKDISVSNRIDPKRTFATGMSNGALLSYRLACDTSLFTAIAPVAGTVVGDCASPKPISVLEIHGLADQSVRMDGMPGAGIASVNGMPVDDVNALWRTTDNCAAPDVTTAAPVTTSIAACANGRTVELITVDGAGHQWPGSDPVRAGAETPSTALDATKTIWAFFEAA